MKNDQSRMSTTKPKSGGSLLNRHKRLVFWFTVIIAVVVVYYAIRYLPYTFGETRRYRDAEVFLGLAILVAAVRISICGFRSPFEEMPKKIIGIGWGYVVVLVPLYILGSLQLIHGSTVVIGGAVATNQLIGPNTYFGPIRKKTYHCLTETTKNEPKLCVARGQFQDADRVSLFDSNDEYIVRFSCLAGAGARNIDKVNVAPVLDESTKSMVPGCSYILRCLSDGEKPMSYTVHSILPQSQYAEDILLEHGFVRQSHEVCPQSGS